MKQSERNRIRDGLECRALKQGPGESAKAHMWHKPYRLDWKKIYDDQLRRRATDDPETEARRHDYHKDVGTGRER